MGRWAPGRSASRLHDSKPPATTRTEAKARSSSRIAAMRDTTPTSQSRMSGVVGEKRATTSSSKLSRKQKSRPRVPGSPAGCERAPAGRAAQCSACVRRSRSVAPPSRSSAAASATDSSSGPPSARGDAVSSSSHADARSGSTSPPSHATSERERHPRPARGIARRRWPHTAVRSALPLLPLPHATTLTAANWRGGEAARACNAANPASRPHSSSSSSSDRAPRAVSSIDDDHVPRVQLRNHESGVNQKFELFWGAFVSGVGLREGCQAAPKSRRGGAECYKSMTLITRNT